jgi:hypothetical protein
MGIHCSDHVTPLYPQRLALTSPTSGGRSVGIVRSRTQATEFSFSFFLSCIIKSVYAVTSENGAESPAAMGLVDAPQQLQKQMARASKSPASTPARVSKDKVGILGYTVSLAYLPIQL